MPGSIEIVIKDNKEKCDSPSLKAFREYMCNKYHVKSVDDIDISTKEYADLLTVFEAGYAAKEKEIIDRWFEKMECEDTRQVQSQRD